MTHVGRLIEGAVRTQAVYVAGELGVADALADGPLPLDELASRTGAHAETLHRFLRALEAEGVFAETEPGVWANTPESEPLRDDALRDFAHFFGGPWYAAFGDALHAVRTGEQTFPRVHDTDWWSWLDAHPEEQTRFDRLMHGAGDETVETLAGLEWRGDETVVDVGGGDGSTMIRLLRRHPTLRGIVFDRAATAAEAERRIAEAGLEDRVDTVAGSFFERVPDGDAHLLVRVLHDWDDEHAATILRGLGERVLLVEDVVPGGPYEEAWFDLLMLVLVRGKERTEPDWRTLLDGAGYRLAAIHEGRVIEAVRCR